MRSKLHRQLAAALAAVLALIAVAIWVTWRNTQQVESTSAWVVHTREVIDVAEHVLRLNVDAETGMRGYLITGNEQFLEPYIAAQRDLPAALQRLLDLTADNSEQQERVRVLQRMSAEHTAYRAQFVALGFQRAIEAARRAYSNGEGKRRLDQIRSAAAQVRAEEERLLTQREQASQEADRHARQTLAALATLIAAIVLGAYAMLRRNLDVLQRAEVALRDSEESLRITLQSIGDAVLATDVAGRVKRMNPVAERMTGWTTAEAASRPVDEVFKIVNEETRQPAPIPVAKVLATGLVQGLANHTVLIARDGTECAIADSAAPIRRTDGQIVGVVLVFRDVTDERRAERMIQEQNALLEQRVLERTADLRQSEERMRLIIASVRDYAILMLDPEGRVLTWNAGAERIKGYAADEIIGRHFSCFYPEADIPSGKPETALARAAKDGRYEAEELGLCKDGATFWADVTITPIRNEAGTLLGYVKVTRDISERKTAQENLRRSEQRLRFALETSHTGAWELNLVDHSAFRSLEHDRIFGYADLLPQWTYEIFLEHVLPEDRAAVDAKFRHAVETGGDWSFECRIRRVDGEIRWIWAAGRQSRDANGAARQMAGIVQDITSRKRAEEQIRELNKNLEQRVAERTQQLEEASRAKSDFLANMSHELRTPLNSIIGFSEILKDGVVGELDTKQHGFVTDIYDAGTHLLSLINDILDLSKVEAGMLQLESVPVDVGALLKASTLVVREKTLVHRIQLATELDPALGTMLADDRKLKQIVYNLLSNAVKFTPEGGAVTLRARRCARAEVALDATMPGRLLPLPPGANDEFLAIAVEDTGVGIAEEHLAKLFEPFTQVDSSATRRHGGTGLGLSLVKRLVQLHGGTVGVVSRPGAGSRFCVWLPYRAAAVALPEGATGPAAMVSSAPAMPLALVIEDDDRMAELIAAQLRAEGFEVMHAATAEEGLVRAARSEPQVITLDIFLPAMDGWEFMRRLKGDLNLPAIPVVIITASDDLDRGLALGARRVLHKPFAREELAAALAGLAGARPDGAQRRVLVADDNVKAVELVAAALEAEGCRVLRAYGGAEAIEAARRDLPNLVILDLIMPGVSGFEVARALGESELTARIPILVLTAKDLTAEDRARLNGKVDAILAKSSFSASALLAEVRRALPQIASN